MQVPLQIRIHNFPHSEALEAHIREKVAKLEEFHPNITSCHVSVEEIGKHHHQGNEFRVGVDLRGPGREIVANRDHHEDVYVALRDAFDAVRRELEDVARLDRGQVKSHELTQHGTVARLFPEEGVGVIVTSDGRELYFSRENVVDSDFDRLEVGMKVQFIEELAAEGRQAKRVSAGKHDGEVTENGRA